MSRSASTLFQDQRAPFHGWVAPVGVGVAVLAVASATAGAAAVDSAGGGPFAEYVVSGGLLYGMLAGFCLLVAGRAGTGTGWRRDLGMSLRLGDLGRGAIVAIVARGASLAAAGVVMATTRFDTDDATRAFDDYEHDTAVLVALVVSALVVAPIVEELFFRGVLQRSLESLLPGGAAVTFAAVLFGLAHLSVDLGPASLSVVVPTAVAGAVFGVSVQRSHRLGPAMVGHFLFNLLAVVLVLSSG